VSTFAATLRARPAWLRIAVSADAIALAGLAVLSATLVGGTWATWGDLGKDTGYDLLAGARTSTGELPYADYTYYYGPLAPSLLGLVFWLGGAGIGSAVALGLAIAAAIVLMTYLLARALTSPVGALLAAGITAPLAFGPTNFSFVLPHTFSASLAVLALLAFLLGIARFAVEERDRWLLAAGAAGGLVALTRPEFELAVVAAGAVWLALRLVERRLSARQLLLAVIPAALIPVLVYGLLATQVSLDALLFENLYPVDEMSAAGNTLVSLQAPLTAASFVELGARALLYAAGCAALLFAARLLARSDRFAWIGWAGLALALAVATAASIARPEALRHGLQYAYGWIPAGAALGVAILLWRYVRRSGKWSPRAQIELVVGVALAVLALKTYDAFFMHATKAQKAVYVLPLAAIFLTHLHLNELARRRTAALLGAGWLAFLTAAGVGLTLKDASAEAKLVRGPTGALAARPGEAAVFNSIVDRITVETRAGDSVLLAPQLTAFYVLTDRENPLPQLSLLPGALPDRGDERRAIANLERAGTRLLVIDRRSFPEYGHTSFGGSFDRLLAGWIERKFVRKTTIGDSPPGSRSVDIWVRRSP
jgi:hypothetical protein